MPHLRIGTFSERGHKKDEFMTDVLRNNTLIMREFRKFGTAMAEQLKHDWREATSENLYKTVDRLRSFSKGILQFVFVFSRSFECITYPNRMLDE